MVEMETFELWVSSEVPLVQGKKKKRRRRRDLHRLVPQSSADRDLALRTAAEPEQQEANPNTDQQNWRNPAWTGSDGACHRGGRLTTRNLSPVNLPFAPASSANTHLENSIAGIPA